MSIPEDVEKLITLALSEDIGSGDITTRAIFEQDKMAAGKFISRQDGIIAGLDLAASIFQRLDSNISFDTRLRDGEVTKKGETLAVVNGPANSILTGERTVLNFMQRMSGVATKTRSFVDTIAHTSANILDTRKTLPGHRYLDKLAVRLGGGRNHRARLDDMFLIKENHITAAGGIVQAIEACNRYANLHEIDAEIEIEVKNKQEIAKVIEHGKVHFILLDNMSIADLKDAVNRIKNRFLTEASGNVNLETVAGIAETGVDFISVGALTHSVSALDISLIFD
ncbi:MAG: carboxylating nicotinate-nucleotide diphosphorylase [Balneolales bacterium]